MPENQINLVYKLNGEIHELDVFQLAPTLLALGELIQESNREVNPGGRQIGVNVKPFRKGSFIIDLTVFPQTHLQQFLDLLNNRPVDQVKTLLEWIGLIAGTPVGVVQLVKWLKGKPKSVEAVGPGEFRYTADDDRSITVAAPVHQLVSNSNITNNIYKVYAVPFEQNISIKDVKTYIEDREESQVVVTKDEAPVLRQYVATPDEVQGTEVVKEQVHHDVYLNPKRGAFDGDPRDWSFRRGGEIVVATIKDIGFLDKCAKGEYRLNQSDLLIVDLLERQRVQGTIVMKPAHEIIRVTSYIRGPEQTTLDLPAAGPA